MSDIYYSSTRGNDEKLTFSEAVVKGIAPDGGLYVPSKFPKLGFNDGLLDLSYQDLAKKILGLYIEDFSVEEISYCVNHAYDSKFRELSIAPIKTFDKVSFVELYHGKTLAFKDMALSILPYLLKTASKKLGIKEKIVILTATSGDTGKAALEGFADVEGMEIIVFYPTNGVSDVQKRQMTTQEGANVTVLGITGNFDDAQSGVKDIFLDEDLKEELKSKGYTFSSANSINIGRLLPQIVYYVHSYLILVKEGHIKNGDLINIVVPTGNFGNILAAYYAKNMGLPVRKFICASNTNNVLTDFINTGVYDIHRKFEVTNSPSMDILISSNLERFLYEISNRDSACVTSLMKSLKQDGRYEITINMKNNLADFSGGFATDEETVEAIHSIYSQYNYVVDTHTAVGFKVYQDYVNETADMTHTLIASTASPFKFTRSVVEGLGIQTEAYNDFELINILSNAAHISVPEPIKDIQYKQILHPRVIDKNNLKKEVVEILK